MHRGVCRGEPLSHESTVQGSPSSGMSWSSFTAIVAPLPSQTRVLQSPLGPNTSVPAGAGMRVHTSQPTHLGSQHWFGPDGQILSETHPGPAHEPSPSQWQVPLQEVVAGSGTWEQTPPMHAAVSQGFEDCGQSWALAHGMLL